MALKAPYMFAKCDAGCLDLTDWRIKEEKEVTQAFLKYIAIVTEVVTLTCDNLSLSLLPHD